jgi:hypothetical protein
VGLAGRGGAGRVVGGEKEGEVAREGEGRDKRERERERERTDAHLHLEWTSFIFSGVFRIRIRMSMLTTSGSAEPETRDHAALFITRRVRVPGTVLYFI